MVINQNLSSLVKSLETDFDRVSESIKKGSKYSRVSFWFLLIFNLAMTVLGAVILIVVRKRQLTGEGNPVLGKILLVVYSFLLLILWLLVFLMILGTATTGAVCGIVRDINKGDQEILDYFTLE